MMIIDKLERMDNFTVQEKEVAKYILENPGKIKDLSTEELAKMTFTSKATVVRLCKKLETKGYNDFKIKLSTEHLEISRTKEVLKDEPITELSTYDEIIETIPNMYYSAITNTKLMLNPNIINRVLNRLKEANKIDLYGYGISYNIAQQAAFKFLSLGIESMAHNGLNEHYIVSGKDYSHRVAIMITFTGKNESIIKSARYLKSKGIYVVAISGCNNDELSKSCNELIEIDTRKLVLSMEVITSVISTQYVLDIFFSMLLASNYEANIKAALEILNSRE
jgi:DNA-binding MurR/RpiR family transcriptional regulator